MAALEGLNRTGIRNGLLLFRLASVASSCSNDDDSLRTSRLILLLCCEPGLANDIARRVTRATQTSTAAIVPRFARRRCMGVQ